MNKITQKKILIVDDDSGDIQLLKEFINSDYVIIEADDGLHAIEIVKSEHPDLVLVDVMMHKISGYSICAYIKSNPETKDIPVVMVTGLGTEINKKIGEEMGADGYMIKPVKPGQLHDVISRFLG